MAHGTGHAAQGTWLVTDVGAGLEALALGLKVVPVAAAAAVDELLALLAGGVEEEASEKRLAAPTDRGQVAEVWGQGDRLIQGTGQGRRRGTQRSLPSSGPLSPPNPSRQQPALHLPAPRPHTPAARALPGAQHGAPRGQQHPAGAWGHPGMPWGGVCLTPPAAHPCACHATAPEPCRRSTQPSPSTGSWHVLPHLLGQHLVAPGQSASTVQREQEVSPWQAPQSLSSGSSTSGMW